MEDGRRYNTRSSSGRHSRSESSIGNVTLAEFTTPEGKAIRKTASKKKPTQSKIRTPSGHQLSTSVGDIRDFFAGLGAEKPRFNTAKISINSLDCSQESFDSCHSAPQNPVELVSDQSTVQSVEATTSLKCKINMTDSFDNSLTAILDEWMWSDDKEEGNNSHLYPISASLMEIREKQLSSGINTLKESLLNKSKQDALGVNTILNASEESITSMSSTTIEKKSRVSSADDVDMEEASMLNMYKMLKEIKEDIKSTQQESKVTRHLQRDLANKLKEKEEEVKLLRKEMQEIRIQNELISKTLNRVEDRIKDNETKMQQLEWSNMKCSVVVTGFYAEKNKMICIQQLYDFFENQVCAEVEIVDAFPLGGWSLGHS